MQRRNRADWARVHALVDLAKGSPPATAKASERGPNEHDIALMTSVARKIAKLQANYLGGRSSKVDLAPSKVTSSK